MHTIEQLGAQTRALQAPRPSELVLQTARFDVMRAWYPAVLGVDWDFENKPAPDAIAKYRPGEKQVRAADVRACFMRLGGANGLAFVIFELPWLVTPNHVEPGLNHMQFTDPSLENLIGRIELLRDAGIHPHRSSNHGPVLSFYFRDPDGNIVEFCCKCFDDPAEVQAFVKSEAFRQNPSGIELDRDEFLAKYHSGMPKRELLKI